MKLLEPRHEKPDSQADLRLCCSHIALKGFLMTWLIYRDEHSLFEMIESITLSTLY